MKKYNTILFDLDGTLVHSSPGIFDGLRFTLRQMGQEPDDRDLSVYLGPPLKKIFEDLLIDPTGADRAVDIYRDHYDEVGCHMCQPYTGIPELLKKLNEAGYILATATCKVQDSAQMILEEKGLAEYFTYIGGSSRDGKIESKAEVIQSVLNELGDKAGNVVMVGDRIDDIRGAAACGLPVIGVLYGYGSRSEQQQGNPVAIAEDVSQLEKLLMAE